MRKNWLLLLATLLITLNFDASAQQQKEKYRNKANDPVSQLPYYKKLRWADGLFRDGSYFNAIEYYQQLLTEQERNPYLHYQLAECYYFTRDYAPASDYYGNCYALSPKLYPESIYKQALMLKMQARYDEAIAMFNKFIADNPKTYKKLKKTAQLQIRGCEMGKKSIYDPIAASVVNAGPNVNSAYTEASPMPLGDTAILFSTMTQNKEVTINKRDKGEYVSRFMIAKKQYHVEQVDSFQWPLKFLDGRFNDPKVHVGNGCYSPGGDRFYFTRCKEEDSLKTQCKIFVSKFNGREWGDPQALGDGINEEGSNTHPYCAKLGKKEILFFSSNRKTQGRGGYDIWYSVIDTRTGAYRRPQNAGKQINTEGNEMTPFYDDRYNKLFFASDGWETMGGFDVFSADGGPSRYTNLSNLGYPINTSADEMYYVNDKSGKDGYVVSNRVGSIALKNPTCCDDIWRIQREPDLVAIGKVVNRESGELIEDVVVKMVDDAGKEKTFDSKDGNFAFNLRRGHTFVITGDKETYVSSRATINTMDIKRTDPSDTARITIYFDTTYNFNFRVENIYYDYDKSDLRPASVEALDSLVDFLNDNSALNVEVYSYTDSKGNAEYNKNLSIKRAQSVITYLESKGIANDRLSVRGFGDKFPVAPNTIGNADNPSGRQLNRRTEIRITTEVPTRRLLFNSAKSGTMNDQMENLKIDNENIEDLVEPNDAESDAARPGGRVNRD